MLLHGGKAINRAGLWKDSARLDRDALPAVGRMMASLAKLDDASAEIPAAQVEQIDAHDDHSVRHDLY